MFQSVKINLTLGTVKELLYDSQDSVMLVTILLSMNLCKIYVCSLGMISLILVYIIQFVAC